MNELVAKAVGYPGKVALADARGSYPGCLAVSLQAKRDANATIAEAINEWAAANPAHLIVFMQVDGACREALILYTKQLSPEDQQELEEHAEIMSKVLQEKREERREQETKARLARQVGRNETLRLAAVGREYEKRLGIVKAMPPGKGKKEAMKKLGRKEEAESIRAVPPLPDSALKVEGEED